MKTTKTIAALSIALILFAFNTFAGKPTGNPDGSLPIKYRVNIHIPAVITVPNVQFYVAVTDKNNHPVAPLQPFSFGNMSYAFEENGPVTGIRIAWIVQSSAGGNRIPLWDNNDLQKGTFLPGHVYQFNIYPKVGKPD